MSAVQVDRVEPGYATVARQYHTAGWAPLPLPRGHKASPPTGTTGAGGKWPTTDDIDAWVATHADGNVAIRMPPDVVGIDIDDYDGKGGGDTLAELERRHGTLPATWKSTSRGQGTSGIRLYRIPVGTRFPGVLGPGIDVIQHHHRYCVVAPSVHPSGDRYRLYDPHGNRATHPPAVDELPDLPDAWVEALKERPEPTRIDTTPAPIGLEHDDSIAERINRDHHWHDVLYTDGWTISHQRGQDTHWTRPGKQDGTSAVLHEPDGPFVVFTTSVEQLQQPWAQRGSSDLWAYSMFGYLAATRHHGDRSACARDYRHATNVITAQAHTLRTAEKALETLGQALEPADSTPAPVHANLIDWAQFWAQDHSDEEWVAYPLIPKGRSIAVYAPAKAGKSTIVLSVVASLVTGNDILGYGDTAPVDVLYLDYEMTPADLMERLTDLGYGPHNDLTRLHYAILPSLPPLDTVPGAHALLALAEQVKAQLVVVDTFGRAVEGDEDKADTVRAFYRYTGLALKARGIAVLRTDHAGKDIERGQRGSSAKADDVDLVWSLRRTETGVAMKRTHSRISWGPTEILIDRHEDPDGTVRYLKVRDANPSGTDDTVKLLDRLGVAPDASMRQATSAVRKAGHKCRNELIRAAQRVRRTTHAALEMPVDNYPQSVPRSSGHAPGTEIGAHLGAHRGTPPETLINIGAHPWGTPGHASEGKCAPLAPLLEGHGHSPAPSRNEITTEDLF